MENFVLNPIGKIHVKESGSYIQLGEQYIDGIKNLGGFGYINILWWFDKCNTKESRQNLIKNKPYKNSPKELGVFATRSPERPNPIALTCSYVTFIDYEKGIIGLAFIDAEDETPILDIKPYTPSFDRVENPIVPDWCSNWPNSTERSAEFDWGSVFLF